MFAVMSARSYQEYFEQLLSSLDSLDRLFVRSFKAKQNDCVMV